MSDNENIVSQRVARERERFSQWLQAEAKEISQKKSKIQSGLLDPDHWWINSDGHVIHDGYDLNFHSSSGEDLTSEFYESCNPFWYYED